MVLAVYLCESRLDQWYIHVKVPGQIVITQESGLALVGELQSKFVFLAPATVTNTRQFKAIHLDIA